MKDKWTLWLTLLTPVTILTSIITAGGGHGTPVPTMLCYPILFLFDIFDSGGGTLVWIVLLGQFPIYGLMVDSAKTAQRKLLIAGLIILFHTILVIIAASTS